MEIYQHRGSLQRTRKMIEQGRLTVGFIGGSITEERVGWNWPEAVCAWLVETFPNVRLQVENAGIGATGSDLAVFRAQRDLITRGCDLVFIEFAVNDSGTPSEQRARTREGLIRKLLKDEERDLVVVYTYQQSMYRAMIEGQVPASIAEFETLASYYNLGSVWMGLHALQEVMAGRMRWEEWLPDGLHPQFRGSYSYAQSVTNYLCKELLKQEDLSLIPSGKALPPPLNPHNWENAQPLPFDAVSLRGPWTVLRWTRSAFIDQVLHTAAVGAQLAFSFDGRGLLLGFDFGKSSAEFRYCLDGGDWQLATRDRPDWCGVDGWFRPYLVAEDLPAGEHSLLLEVTHGDPDASPEMAGRCSGTNFNLAFIGIIP